MPWGVAAAAVGSIISGSMQADAASDASKAQTQSSEAAIGESRRQFDLNRSDFEPYRAAGAASIGKLQQQTGLTPAVGQTYTDPTGNILGTAGFKVQYTPEGWADMSGNLLPPSIVNRIPRSNVDAPLTRKFTMEDFNADPVTKASFDFGLSEGEKAVQRMFGARGLSRSGAAVKAASRFATDYTGTKAGESRQRFVEDQNNEFNKLSAISGTGQAATTATAATGTQISNNIGNTLTAEGNARGAAAIARGNAIGGGFSGAGNAISGQFTLDRILGGRTSNMPLVQESVPGQFSLTNPQYGGPP